jgi:outer membrane immunogenic protein
MRTVAFAAAFAACLGVSGIASAADLSLKDTPEIEYAPVLGWTGLYVGVHGGYGWGDVEVGDTFDYAGDPFAKNTIEADGVLGGVQIGYNWQRGNVVLGIEGELGYMDLDGSVSDDLPRPLDSRGRPIKDPTADINGTYSMSGGIYGDLTGRLGYATSSTLLYLKGGVAFLNADFNANYVGQNCSTVGGGCGNNNTPRANTSKFNFDDSETMVGWTIGVGAEYALTSSLSLKVEYQHFDFGSASFDSYGTYNFGTPGKCGNCTSKLTSSRDEDVTVDAVKVGVNYRFNGGEEALK